MLRLQNEKKCSVMVSWQPCNCKKKALNLEEIEYNIISWFVCTYKSPVLRLGNSASLIFFNRTTSVETKQTKLLKIYISGNISSKIPWYCKNPIVATYHTKLALRWPKQLPADPLPCFFQGLSKNTRVTNGIVKYQIIISLNISNFILCSVEFSWESFRFFYHNR